MVVVDRRGYNRGQRRGIFIKYITHFIWWWLLNIFTQEGENQDKEGRWNQERRRRGRKYDWTGMVWWTQCPLDREGRLIQDRLFLFSVPVHFVFKNYISISCFVAFYRTIFTLIFIRCLFWNYKELDRIHRRKERDEGIICIGIYSIQGPTNDQEMNRRVLYASMSSALPLFRDKQKWFNQGNLD